MENFQKFHCTKNVILNAFFVIYAEGFKFAVLGLPVVFFQQLKRGISCRLPLIPVIGFPLASVTGTD